MASFQCRLKGSVSSILFLLRRIRPPQSNLSRRLSERPVPGVPDLHILEVLLAVGRPWVTSRTLESYWGTVDLYLVPKLGPVPLEKLAPRHVQEMEAQLLENGGRDGGPLSPRTVVQVHRVLSKAMNDAVKLGIVLKNAVDAV